MNGKSHLISSVCITGTVASMAFHDNYVIPSLLGGFSALIADIDLSNSTISNTILGNTANNKVFKIFHISNLARKIILSLIFLAIAYILNYFKLNMYLVAISLYYILIIWSKHRTLSHCLLSAVIISFLTVKGLMAYGNMEYGFYIFIGYLLHILEDLLTPKGVPLFYPFTAKKYRLPIVKSKLIEEGFVILTIIFFAINVLGKKGI